ncbi:RNA polymerase recycling motor ATPase HelR [Aeromicrobium sp. CF4.19]|uniref:RNA polymerase recycling motor ATPase HelR n=1 Tax=Aeromicrobium sp. CF4.19 TaxID=3373082 RepID=UPI003EE58F0D
MTQDPQPAPAAGDGVFDLPERLAAKAEPSLVGPDADHLAAIARSLEQSIVEQESRRAELLKAPAGDGQAAVERDQEVRRLSSRLRVLGSHGMDLCLGRMVPADGSTPVYVGRLGLTDRDGRRLLIDWRSPAAEPFFGATHADPMGLASRRRYRWTQGRVSDYWDEVFTADGLQGHAALDDQSAFIASLGADRSSRMRDVLGTIQADQDAIVRAGSQGALVVDGGPGTGKTVVALHRTAYLLHSDPRVDHRRGGVLFVGPHSPYLAYVGDVLPSLGEEGVQTCTLRDLVPEGATARPEHVPQVARLKANARMVDAIEPAVALHEEPPTVSLLVETPWAEVRLTATDWAEAFAAPDPGTPHNEAREQVWEAIVDILLDQHDEDEDLSPDLLRRALTADEDLVETFQRAWPLLEATDVVADLWSVPAYLRRCAPWLSPAEVDLLRRDEGEPWTTSDLPLLDAARRRVGDRGASARRRRDEAAAAAEREQMDRVVDDLVAADDSDLMVMSMLRGQDLRNSLVDDAGRETADPDELAGPFAHVVVDEAQELTDAEWQVLLQRCPSRSFTIVGDRAQAREAFVESWQQRLERVGLDRIDVATLSINYRTPEEIMTEAEPVIRAVLPDANVPTSVRATGVPVQHGTVPELGRILDGWLDEEADGVACVIAPAGMRVEVPETSRVRILTPELAKGLEFDLVVLLGPDQLGAGHEAAVDRYVAMTRATQRLVLLTGAV